MTLEQVQQHCSSPVVFFGTFSAEDSPPCWSSETDGHDTKCQFEQQFPV